MKEKGFVLPSILSIIWAIIVTVIGSFVSLGILNGFVSPSFFLFLLRFLLFGLVLGLIATAPFFFLFRYTTEKPALRKILIVIMLITFILPSFMLLKITKLTNTKFISVPIPLHVKDYEYKFEMRDGITPTAFLVFRWGKNLTPGENPERISEENIEMMKKTAKFFDDLVARTGGGQYSSDYLNHYSLCTTAIESKYQRFKEEIKGLEETPFGYIDPITKNYKHPGVGVDCGFTIKSRNVLPIVVSYYVKIGKSGAEIQFSSQDFSRYRP